MDEPAPPEDLPADAADALHALDGHDLREAIVYAQELLRARQEPFPSVEPAGDEEVVRVDEHEGYLEVHKRHRGADGRLGGRYVYHVASERHPDGSVRLRWSLIGRAEERDDHAGDR
ncbi:hypothetical protein [Halomarina oriensis]|uniref:Uncharacterized protein n=1 Tax=Halomarina oriensis TaxID=671145 RepID=A0A6B0GMH3_9EURY|nr:hypothetical protein [Halomarina oriensis]MWG35850.1 hypothetical protein [Halomarina oriensis]